MLLLGVAISSPLCVGRGNLFRMFREEPDVLVVAGLLISVFERNVYVASAQRAKTAFLSLRADTSINHVGIERWPMKRVDANHFRTIGHRD